jgi:hypothetical protein
MHQAGGISMFLPTVTLLVKPANWQAGNGGIERIIVTVAGVDI